MCSLDATNTTLLARVCELIKDEPCQETRELELVSKSHDDLFFGPPKSGERACNLEDKCICVWLARMRYGYGSKYEFIPKEFLLPSQKKAFDQDGTLPATHGKCLICARYFATSIYVLARTSPTFNPKSPITLQAFANKVAVNNPGLEATPYANSVGDEDGYAADKMLFADERWAGQSNSRSELGTLLWKPQVRFLSSDYTFHCDESGPFVTQDRMSAQNGSHFVRPS